jgi:hypothetical protein
MRFQLAGIRLPSIPANAISNLQTAIAPADGNRPATALSDGRLRITVGAVGTVMRDISRALAKILVAAAAMAIAFAPDPAARGTQPGTFSAHQELKVLSAVGMRSVIDVASSTVEVAVRKGTPKPDISSPEAVRRTLLAAKSIARPDPSLGGSSGVHIAQALEHLGITEELRSTTILASRPDREQEMPGSFVASGRAEIALHQIQEFNGGSRR